MQRWSQLATRNWRAKPVRTLGVIAAIALGVGAVVWVTCCYESVQRTIAQWAGGYVGRSQINVESMLGKFNPFTDRAVGALRDLAEVKHVVPLLTQRLSGRIVPPEALANAPRLTMWEPDVPEFDLMGIDVEAEPLIRDYEVLPGGRLFGPTERDVCLLESGYAQENGIERGEILLLWYFARPEASEVEIIGFFERRRIAQFQRPLVLLPLETLQRIVAKPRMITSVDIVLREDDPDRRRAAQESGTDVPAEAAPTTEQLSRAGRAIKATMDRFGARVNVTDAGSKMRQIERARAQQDLVLMLLSSVALLTALFIILSTLSMGMIERIAQLGVMRCVGMTRGQMSSLIFREALPLGFVGILLGVPIGLALMWVTIQLVPDYFGAWAISWNGMTLAVVGGFLTTVLAAILPAWAASRVSPLEAAHPRARTAHRASILIAALLALALLAMQWWVMEHYVRRSLTFVDWSTTAVVLLYLGYACLAPVGIWLFSGPAVAVVAAAVGLRRQLLQDQVGHAVWRSSGITCGLMVGLSLIVGLSVFSSTFRSGWQFPKQFPAAYLWSFEQLSARTVNKVGEVPGVGAFTVANAKNAITVEKPLFMEQLVKSITWFLAIDPQQFFELVRLEFIEGERAAALARLEQGGAVVVAKDFAETRNKHLGDRVKVWINNVQREFEIVGVVDSPALDVASTYFQAQSEMHVAAVGSVIGTRADLERLWDIDEFCMILLNFDLPPQPPPADWPPARTTAAGARLPAFCFDERLPVERRHQRWREDVVLREVKRVANAPAAFTGTVSELKNEIDTRITQMTLLLSAVPAVALLVAALGVANLMTANVASRGKQIAMMRAVGATQGQILRLIFGESLVLGVLGSALGLALGVHLAVNASQMAAEMWGQATQVTIPWLHVGSAAVLTISLCILAAMWPARYAARANVIEALHTS